jgi:hypothetical protein
LVGCTTSANGGLEPDGRSATSEAKFSINHLNERIAIAASTGQEWPFDLVLTTQRLFEANGAVRIGIVENSGDAADVTFWINWDGPPPGFDYFRVRYERLPDRTWRLSEILANDEIAEAKSARTGAYRSMVTAGFVRFSLGSALNTFDSGELILVESIHGSSVEYEISPLSIVPLAFPGAVNSDGSEEKPTFYNFRGVANGLAWCLSAVLADAKVTNVRKVLDSPWHYALFAPDCRVRMRIAGNLKFLLGTRTDYLLYRSATTERGIAFTPHIGLDLSGGDYGGSHGYGGLSVSVGYRSWLNLDGDANSGELALLVALWGYPDTP